MSNTVITLAFEAYKAEQEALGLPVILDEFVLANVPDLDPSVPVDPNEGLPDEEHIVYISDVSQTGYVSPNAVVYSLIMDTSIGDFDFNWIGLRNKASDVLAAISHIPLVHKLKTIVGEQNGNAITRSIMMSYSGAKQLTEIHVDASTWQIDFTARLFGTDEAARLSNVDHYYSASFINDGFKVVKEEVIDTALTTPIVYKATKGTGYVEGLRCAIENDRPITDVLTPSRIYVDASWQGQVTSQWNTVIKLISSRDNLVDYIDEDGYAHYVTHIAEIDAVGNITDTRFLGGSPSFERQDNAATDSDIDEESTESKHVKLAQFWRGITNKISEAFTGRTIATTSPLQGGGNLSTDRTLSIDDATIAQKGAVQLSDSVNSTSTILGATASAVKLAYDKAVEALNVANSKWTYVVASTTVYGATKLSTAIDSTSTAEAATPSAVKSAYDLAAAKAAQATTIATTSPLLGGGDLSADRTLSISDATTEQKGAVQLTDSVSTVSSILSATATAVKTAYDKGVEALGVANAKWTYVAASTTVSGATQLSTAIDSTSTVLAATPSAVKSAYDLAAGKAAQTITIATTSPLQGGGDLSADRTLSIADGTTAQKGAVQLSTSISSTSTLLAATPSAVKAAYDLADKSICPVGVPLPWPNEAIPSGFLACVGQAFSITTYPLLGAVYPNGTLPDLRGEFIRGWDDDKGTDPGRLIGSYQAASRHSEKRRIEGYAGAAWGDEYSPGTVENHESRTPVGPSGELALGGDIKALMLSWDAVPRNVAYLYIVRAA
ncbi:tail fiber protein [Psychromonas ossibalaenae]|uniref:tail fiber protein n=1 Tax=Psychromonas ossibalaenae TaxID=444922 RepID=UPI000378E154|nr:tail fiber protein [Psychromonas ossibalaenae]